MSMIEMMILGFLSQKPMCGYELRKRMEQLQGYARTFSDGAIYPAAKRLVDAGLLSETDGTVDGRQRRQFALTPRGRSTLVDALTHADGFYLTDSTRWTVILTFLSVVPDKRARNAVLRRRYDYLSTSDVHYFYCDSGRGLEAEEIDDPYRRGILAIHEAQLAAELAWLRGELGIAS
ncbi:MAG: PadR family transcriptional regulator [Bifidobacterium sp.]|jgi:DNA-binding PadR family transcriptional regulator|nr:PadR family transcriptional regulator [Bifidobacterium sp.]MCI1865387.1 PadR family transcriptional regulator [Bifidobacterium sp.]